MLTPLLLAAGLLVQVSDTTLVFDAWRGLWRRPFDTSAAAFRNILQNARAPDVRASAYVGLAFLASRREGVAPALALFDSAARIGPTHNPNIEPQLRCTRAGILSFGGLPGARDDARLGLLRAASATSDSARGWCYHALATVALNESTDPRVVLALLDSAVAIQTAVGDDDLRAVTLFTRGYLQHFIGNLAAAKRDLGDARAAALATGSRFALAFVHRFLGDIHLSTGDWASAAAEYEAAWAESTFLGDGLGLRGIKRGMATAQMGVGRLDAAEAALRDALAEAEAAGMAEGVYNARVELATVKRLQGDYEGARIETENAAAYGLRTGHQAWVQQLGYHRGLYALRQGRLALAERYLRDWLRDVAPAVVVSRYAARVRLAEVLVRRGKLDAGLAEVSGAMDQLDSLRAGTEDRVLRTLVFQAARSMVDEPDLGLATIVAALVGAGRVEEAFLLSERRRARMLGERLLRDRLSEGSAAAAPHHEPASRVPIAAIRAALPEESALVEFLAGHWGQPSVAFLLTRNTLDAVLLPSFDSLAGLGERLAALLAAGESADAPARLLGEAILQPVLARLGEGITTLHIVPDGFLHRLPFDALILADGRLALDRFVIGVVPSAAVAYTLAQGTRGVGSGRVLAFGDPRFADETVPPADLTESVYRVAFDSSGGLPRLRASAGEARNAVRYRPKGELRLRGSASEAYLKRVPRDRFQVIHFATHALVDERTSSRTALALAPGDGEDGFLGPGELATLALGADLIVLSACRTAGGTMVEGEGIQGLTAPFLEGGARAVVATMWPVADALAAGFAAEFYAALAEGLPVGHALRAAKLARRAAGAPPAEWAAFTAIGDPLLEIPLRRSSTVATLWLTIAGVTVLAGLLVAGRAFRARSPRTA